MRRRNQINCVLRARAAVALTLVLGLSASTFGAFHDGFNTTTYGGPYAPDSVINGQNGWVTMTDPWGTVCGDVQADGYDGGRGWAFDATWGSGLKGGVARDVSGDAGGGIYEVSAIVHCQYHASGTADFKELHVGTDDLLTGANPFSGYTLHWDDRNSVNQMYLLSWRNGVRSDDAVIYSMDGGAQPAPFVWVVMGITIDFNAGMAWAWWQDTDMANPNPTGVGPRNVIGNYAGPLAVTEAQIQAAGFMTADYGWLDEFNSVPEPMTMSLIGLGGLLLARRRR